MRVWSGAALLVTVALLLICDGGEAYNPLHIEGQGGFWNQIVVGKDKAYSDRIGGLTVKGKVPLVTFIDRETPLEYAKRWDMTAENKKLTIHRAHPGLKLFSVDGMGNAIFKGKMKIDGVLRVKNLELYGLASNSVTEEQSTLKIGTNLTASMKLGNYKQTAYIQTEKEVHLAFNPAATKVEMGTTMLGESTPKHTVDVKEDMYVAAKLKMGKMGRTTLEANQLTFAFGGGWTSTDTAWISSLKTKPVQMGGGVFGTRLGVGTDIAEADIAPGKKKEGFRLEVHNGHFVVTRKIGKFLKGLTTYMMPEGGHMKAYDYSRKALQKWRITGTKILLNPGQKSDGRVCIGCEKPEHHLQSEGNMYVNGNVFVNKHLHVKGHMHIDKIITPQVFIHSAIETPKYGRGVMIGNDLPNKWKTTTNMRMGYTETYAWIQSHKEVPLVINPIGGATCIACKAPKKHMELQIGGHALVDGEVFVATLKKKTPAPTPVPTAAAPAEEESEQLREGEESQDEALSLEEAKDVLENEMGAVELNVMSAWSSAAKIMQNNHRKIQDRNSQIQQNENAIRALERQLSL